MGACLEHTRAAMASGGRSKKKAHGGRGGRHGAKNRFYKRSVMDLKNRGRDLDRIQADVADMAAGKPAPFLRELHDTVDLPGAGEHYCVSCARHFVDAATMALHVRTKDHKKQAKRVAGETYTQKDAEAAAGMSH